MARVRSGIRSGIGLAVTVIFFVGERLLHRLGAVIDVDAGATFDHVLERKVVAAVGGQHIGDVQEAVRPATERHECGADARLDVDDLALVDVS